MVLLSVRVRPPRNQGDGVQLTELHDTEIWTVTGSPRPRLLSEAGVTETVAPLTEAPARYWLTTCLTSLSVALSIIARRAPSREALVMICFTIIARPNSITPTTKRKNRGAMTANSTSAAPRRRDLFCRRMRFRGEPAPDTCGLRPHRTSIVML